MIQTTTHSNSDTGVTPVIGFILIIAISVLGIGIYVTQFTPILTFQEETSTHTDIEHDMKNLNLDMLNTAESGLSRERPIDVRVDYPTSYPGIPLSDTLTTETTAPNSVQVTVDGVTEFNQLSKEVTYQPRFNEYSSAEDIFIEHSVVGFESENGNTVVRSTGQQIVNGNQITLLTVQGEFTTGSSQHFSVHTTPTQTFEAETVTAETELELTLDTKFDKSEWESLLEDELAENGGSITDISKVDDTLTITFEDGEYTLNTSTIELDA